MNIIPGLKYSSDHEWIQKEGNNVKIGITNYAQLQLGDIVYVEMAEEGTELVKGDVICAVESVKTAADVYSPVSGTVIKVNYDLDGSPEMVNSEPYESWIVEIELSDPEELTSLMDESEYAKYCESEA